MHLKKIYPGTPVTHRDHCVLNTQNTSQVIYSALSVAMIYPSYQTTNHNIMIKWYKVIEALIHHGRNYFLNDIPAEN